MAFSKLRSQIGTLLGTVSKIQEVSNAPKVKFTGYPAAHVVPSDNESDYESTSENVRTYAFFVRVFYETKTTTIENAYTALEDLVDDLLDLFDQEDQKGASSRTIGMSLPSRYQYLNIWAVPTAWGEFPGENLIMAQLTIRIRISVDIEP